MGYYRRYTGSRRRKKRHMLLGMLILLLVLVLAAVGLYLYAHWAELPAWLHMTQDDTPASNPDDPANGQAAGDSDEDFDLIIENPTPPEDEPEPETPTLTWVYAWHTEGASLLADMPGVLTDFRDSGLPQLAIVVKDAEGYSLLPDGETEQGAVSEQAEAFARALSDVKNASAEAPIAILPALRDNLRPRKLYRASALHVDSGATWLDRNYEAWFNPAGKDTEGCLLAQLEACAIQGFSHVILTDFQYPTLGKTELIDYGDIPSRAAALTDLARRISEASPISLGLVLTDAAVQNLLDSDSGQDVMELAQYFDVLYADVSDADVDLEPLKQALSETDCRLGVFSVWGNAISDDTLDMVMMSAK